jgi:tetratricopeptide (TPR) repeat protein
MLNYDFFAFIAAIPACIALLLYVFAWLWQLTHSQKEYQPSINRSVQTSVTNTHIPGLPRGNMLPLPASINLPSMLLDSNLSLGSHRDQRAAQRAAKQLTQGNVDKTILFATKCLKRRKKLRWNALLHEVAALPVAHQKSWIEQHIADAIEAIDKGNIPDARTRYTNASELVVLCTWYSNMVNEKSLESAMNWYNIGKAYNSLIVLSRKGDATFQGAALNCYQHALNTSTKSENMPDKRFQVTLFRLMGDIYKNFVSSSIDQAVSLSAAIDCFEQALKLVEDLPNFPFDDKAHLYERMGEVYYQLYMLRKQKNYLEQAQRAYEEWLKLSQQPAPQQQYLLQNSAKNVQRLNDIRRQL